MTDKHTDAEKASLIFGGILALLSVSLFIITLLAISGAFPEGSRIYAIYGTITYVIGDGMVFMGDVPFALCIFLLYQAFRLMERRKFSRARVLYSLWLFVPYTLIVSALCPNGLIPDAIRSVFLQVPAIPIILSIILSIIFRSFITVAGGDEVVTGRALDIPDKVLLPKEETPAEDILRTVLDKAAKMEDSLQEKDIRIAELEQKLEKLNLDTTIQNQRFEIKDRIQKLALSGEPTYQSLSRKRKELMKIDANDLRSETKNLKGFTAYTSKSGEVNTFTGYINNMESFIFSPIEFEIENSRKTRKVISFESVAVPAFSENQAKEILIKEIEEYSKGGYKFSRLSAEPEMTESRSVSYDDFVLPWYSKELSYSGKDAQDTYFMWDFHFKYSADRDLEPRYSGKSRKRLSSE